MKRQFKHNSGAYIVVDENGKKTLHKHGKIFKTFIEIKKFETEMKNKGIDLNKHPDSNFLKILQRLYTKIIIG